jgi:hypothetical protein
MHVYQWANINIIKEVLEMYNLTMLHILDLPTKSRSENNFLKNIK